MIKKVKEKGKFIGSTKTNLNLTMMIMNIIIKIMIRIWLLKKYRIKSLKKIIRRNKIKIANL